MNDRTIDEIVAEMHKEAESKDLFNGEEVGEPLIRGTRVEAWANDLDAATGRERSKWERERRAYEKLHDCFWEGDAIQNIIRQMLNARNDLRRINPQEADDLSFYAHELMKAAKKQPAPQGRNAALRKALEACLNYLMRVDHPMNDYMRTRFESAIQNAATALKAPPRNCDRCEFWEELWHVFSSNLCPDVTDENQRAWLFIRWLFDKAEDGAPMNRHVGGQEGGAR
jgi:hypothetical protein